MTITRLILGAGAVALLTGLGTPPAKAIDLQISGSISQEIGIKITGKRNPNNAAGNPFNGVTQPFHREADGEPEDLSDAPSSTRSGD